jgi:hypothetical protein
VYGYTDNKTCATRETHSNTNSPHSKVARRKNKSKCFVVVWFFYLFTNFGYDTRYLSLQLHTILQTEKDQFEKLKFDMTALHTMCASLKTEVMNFQTKIAEGFHLTISLVSVNRLIP